MNVVRIYNMRTWMANGIYSFEQFAPNSDLEISINSKATTEASSNEEFKIEEVPSFITQATVVDVTKLTVME